MPGQCGVQPQIKSWNFEDQYNIEEREFNRPVEGNFQIYDGDLPSAAFEGDKALDQLVNEKFGIAKDAHERWRTDDEGMHVFAACLYAIMKEEHYNQQGEIFEQFLARMIASKMSPGKLKQLYTNFMQNA